MNDVGVTTGSSKNEGGCNGCTDHITEFGGQNHKVYVIQLRGVIVRVCDSCRKELLLKLAKAGDIYG